jgi:hypothetical protein
MVGCSEKAEGLRNLHRLNSSHGRAMGERPTALCAGLNGLSTRDRGGDYTTWGVGWVCGSVSSIREGRTASLIRVITMFRVTVGYDLCRV